MREMSTGDTEYLNTKISGTNRRQNNRHLLHSKKKPKTYILHFIKLDSLIRMNCRCLQSFDTE